MSAMLASLIGALTLLLRGFKPDARVSIGRREISESGMALLLMPFYLAPWGIILGLGPFLRR